jgi:hypothetical protein
LGVRGCQDDAELRKSEQSFAPRRFAELLDALVRDGVPATPIDTGVCRLPERRQRAVSVRDWPCCIGHNVRTFASSDEIRR